MRSSQVVDHRAGTGVARAVRLARHGRDHDELEPAVRRRTPGLAIPVASARKSYGQPGADFGTVGARAGTRGDDATALRTGRSPAVRARRALWCRKTERRRRFRTRRSGPDALLVPSSSAYRLLRGGLALCEVDESAVALVAIAGFRLLAVAPSPASSACAGRRPRWRRSTTGGPSPATTSADGAGACSCDRRDVVGRTPIDRATMAACRGLPPSASP